MDEKYMTPEYQIQVHKPTHYCDGKTRRPTKRKLEQLCERFNSDGKVKHEHHKRARS